MNGIVCQNGTLIWALKGNEDGEEIDMSLIFDANWRHSKIPSVNHALNVSEFEGKYYEWGLLQNLFELKPLIITK